MTFPSLLRSLSFALATVVMASLTPLAHAAEPIKIVGAGASFPAPLYLRWFRDYYLAHPNVQIDYQAIGSGGGIANLINGLLDFAGSDVPMKPEDAAKVPGGVVQIPMTAGAVVIAYHLDGVDGIKLSREAIAGIFTGQIARWNDPLIAATNPGVELPDLPIVVVTRGDASGTTFVTTRHLGAVSDAFNRNVGVDMNPVWPKVLQERGALIRGQGNGGVAAFIRAIPGSIGYLQYAYAGLTNMQMALMQNRAGDYVPPDSASFRAAVESFRAEMDLSEIADPKGDGSYPVLSLSWLILRKDYPEDKAAVIRDVIRYALTDGQQVAGLLGYIPLTEAAVALLQQKVEQIQ
ncbi:phosphate ABC transporter substrate-binding protein PstS [Thiocystis violacea]|uniref:phosphate ABC transporter substrate-binding protein PstS n=1 Tax=Thiocystis violacea TaxID=13725 RepID=UPI0019059DA5|nr:phosphate ABC transporter substrate-binding protein PstS [Thiocystis violacea]MBK1724103.1 phosphate ABC transporter substrate-binding protein PstS [Thiocystis violacea]